MDKSPMKKRKEIFQVKSVLVDPFSMDKPSSAPEYLSRGIAFYARQKFVEAEVDLQQAVALDCNNIDAFYSLGMVLKGMQLKDNAVAAFSRAITLILALPDAKTIRYAMLRRLALGHINQLTQGDWNLEKEIWKRNT